LNFPGRFSHGSRAQKDAKNVVVSGPPANMTANVPSSPASAASDRAKEKASSPPTSPTASNDMENITDLNENDVLGGRGTGASQFVGTRKFRALCDERKAEYVACEEYKQKEEIAKEILAQVHSKGGRFLSLVGGKRPKGGSVVEAGVWFEVSLAMCDS